MKGVRFTKAELVVIEGLLEKAWDRTFEDSDAPRRRTVESVRAKLKAAQEAPSGVSVKPIEEALIKASRGKVIPLESGHAIASRRLTAEKVTVELAELVGGYMARQNWLTSPMTVLDVLNKWHQWLPKARATQPPPALSPGLGADGQSGPSPAQAGKPATGRRPAQGFR